MAAKKAASASAAILANPNAQAMVEALLAQVAAGKVAAAPAGKTVIATLEDRGATAEIIADRPLEADEQGAFDLAMAHGKTTTWALNGLQLTRLMAYEVKRSDGATVRYERVGSKMGRFFKNMSK
jgi:hypothetical protein